MSDEQVKMDLEDAILRLAQMKKAIKKRDAAEAEVKELTGKLAQAKRRAREAGWKLSLVLNQERKS
jgi:hypothetical protein